MHSASKRFSTDENVSQAATGIYKDGNKKMLRSKV